MNQKFLFPTTVIFAVITSFSYADIVEYNVDISGTDPVSGNHLRVAGTMTADTDTNDVVSRSNLDLFYNGIGQFGFDQSFGGEGSGWEWFASLTELRFIRTSTEQGVYYFHEPGPPMYGMWLQSGTNSSHILFWNPLDGSHVDTVVLHSASGPDGNGFLVGTSSVPEPGSLLFFRLFLLRPV